MFLSPKIWGCKYTNYFLFINKKAEFQSLGMLITPDRHPSATSWQLLLRLLPDSLYSGSGNVSPCRKTATTVQPFGHFTVQWLISTRQDGNVNINGSAETQNASGQSHISGYSPSPTTSISA